MMEAAKRMGGKLTEEEAEAVIEEALSTRRHLSADRLARWLGLTFNVRPRSRHHHDRQRGCHETRSQRDTQAPEHGGQGAQAP